jgi:hypothetical protein
VASMWVLETEGDALQGKLFEDVGTRAR